MLRRKVKILFTGSGASTSTFYVKVGLCTTPSTRIMPTKKQTNEYKSGYCDWIYNNLLITRRGDCDELGDRGVFRTLSNIWDGAHCEKNWRLKAVKYFCKRFHFICLTRFWIRLWKQRGYRSRTLVENGLCSRSKFHKFIGKYLCWGLRLRSASSQVHMV